MTDQPADDGHAQQAYLQQLHRTIGGLNTANGTFRQQLRAAEDELARLRPLPAQLAAAQREAEHARALAQIAESRTEDWRRAHRDQVGLVTRMETQVAAVEAERDGAYRERAHLTAWLAAIHPAVVTPASDHADDGWQILYLYAGGRQLSWHIHPRDADLYAHVEHVDHGDARGRWDGHTTEQKYEAIRTLAAGQLAAP